MKGTGIFHEVLKMSGYCPHYFVTGDKNTHMKENAKISKQRKKIKDQQN